MSAKLCPFCLESNLLNGKILYQDDFWYYVQFEDGELAHGGMIITTRHILTPFEINEAEWRKLHRLLPKFKALIDEHDPDGYNLGWNIYPTAGQNIAHAQRPI